MVTPACGVQVSVTCGMYFVLLHLVTVFNVSLFLHLVSVFNLPPFIPLVTVLNVSLFLKLRTAFNALPASTFGYCA